MVLVVLMVCMPIRNYPSLASRSEPSCADPRRKVKSSFDLFSRTFAAIVAELQTHSTRCWVYHCGLMKGECLSQHSNRTLRMIKNGWRYLDRLSVHISEGTLKIQGTVKNIFYFILSWTCLNLVLLFFLFRIFWLHYCSFLTLLEWCHGTKIVSDALAVLCSTKQSTWAETCPQLWEHFKRCRDEASWAAVAFHNTSQHKRVSNNPCYSTFGTLVFYFAKPGRLVTWSNLTSAHLNCRFIMIFFSENPHIGQIHKCFMYQDADML